MPRAAVFAAMRNEGPFLLEWVAYHRVIGFDAILIASNDCTDGSDKLLDLLAEAGEIIHLPHSPAQGTAPQDSAMRLALDWTKANPTDWLLHIDADEFLMLADSLRALLAVGQGADVIALRWKLFGDAGLTRYPGATLPHFTRCEAAPSEDYTKFKSLFRPSAFGHAYDHMPTAPLRPVRVVSAKGDSLDAKPLSSNRRHSRYRPLHLSFQEGLGHINHYATRSQDCFTYRQSRGDGQGKDGSKYRLNSRWHQLANRNEVSDTAILRHWPATERELARLRSIPAVLDAEQRSLAYFMAATERAKP